MAEIALGSIIGILVGLVVFFTWQVRQANRRERVYISRRLSSADAMHEEQTRRHDMIELARGGQATFVLHERQWITTAHTFTYTSDEILEAILW